MEDRISLSEALKLDGKILLLAGHIGIVRRFFWENDISFTTYNDKFVFAQYVSDLKGVNVSALMKISSYEDTPDLYEICEALDDNIPCVEY